MRYEIRLSGEEHGNGKIFLHEIMEQFDNEVDAKQYAGIHCWDGQNGVAIVDTETYMVDMGGSGSVS